MRILSATEAVSPAIARTKLVLFKPFRFGRTWKLSATSEIAMQGTNFFPLLLFVLFFLPSIHRAAPAAWITWGAAFGSLLLTVLGAVLFILLSHLQFAFFDIVANRGEFVAPAWRKYSLLHRRWTNFKMIAGTCLTAVIGIPLVIVIHRAFVVSTTGTKYQPGPAAPFAFFLFFIAIYGGIILVFLSFSLLNDFMMPPIALEDASIAQAWQWVWRQICVEPGQFALYALLKIVLGFVALMAVGIIFEIVYLLLGLLFLAVGAAAAAFLQHVNAPQILITGLVIAFVCCLFVPFLIYVRFGLGGIAITFLEAYKLYFLGGRYPPLGDLLDRSTPAPEPYTPPPGYLAYASDTLPPPTNPLL